MSVPTRFTAESNAIELGTPVPLFAVHFGSLGQGILRRRYSATADGQRFLVDAMVDDPNISPITLILNWKSKGGASE